MDTSANDSPPPADSEAYSRRVSLLAQCSGIHLLSNPARWAWTQRVGARVLVGTPAGAPAPGDPQLAPHGPGAVSGGPSSVVRRRPCQAGVPADPPHLVAGRTSGATKPGRRRWPGASTPRSRRARQLSNCGIPTTQRASPAPRCAADGRRIIDSGASPDVVGANAAPMGYLEGAEQFREAVVQRARVPGGSLTKTHPGAGHGARRRYAPRASSHSTAPPTATE